MAVVAVISLDQLPVPLKTLVATRMGELQIITVKLENCFHEDYQLD